MRRGVHRGGRASREPRGAARTATWRALMMSSEPGAHAHAHGTEGASAPALARSRPIEERGQVAFDEYATQGVLAAVNFEAAFRRAGFPDARTEEVERYHHNFVHQRAEMQGVTGTHLRRDEFVRILQSHDQKRRFLQHVRISGKDWVCNAVRGVSHQFTRSTFAQGQCVWAANRADSTMGIIMSGRAMLWGRKGGEVDFPLWEVGANTVVGDTLMPRMSTRLVALGPVDVLLIPLSEVKLRLGDRFIQEMAAQLEVKERHAQHRLSTMQRVCKRAMGDQSLSQLPFLPLKNQMKEQLAQGMQKLAQAQSKERAALQAAKRAKALRMSGRGVDMSDDRPLSSLAEKGRIFRMERSGQLLSAPTAKHPTSVSTRPRTSMSRGQLSSSIPRQIAASEFHVCIDTGTMTYDDLR